MYLLDESRPKTEVDKDHVDFVFKVYGNKNLSIDSQLSSSSEVEFLSSTDPTEEGLSDSEKRKRTIPEQMAPISGPEPQLQEVKNLWGSEVSASLENILTEFDDFFMKHKADIGRCTIVKHPVEVEPGAIPHREGASRMSPEKAERANKEVLPCFLYKEDIQPACPWNDSTSLSWALGQRDSHGQKSGELRFCCDFRLLNEVTVKDAYSLPRMDESLARLDKAKVYTSIDLA